MRTTRVQRPHFASDFNASGILVTPLLVLLFLISLFLVLSITAQPAYAQNSVPPTARQAATMPQFAARLGPAKAAPGYPSYGRAQASFKNLAEARTHGSHGWLPDDNVVYTNGPINGTTDAWTLNFGFAVSNTFTVPSGGASLTSMTFGAWLFPGDVLQTSEVLIGTSEYGNTISDQVVSFNQSSCSGNQYGFNVCTEGGNLTAVNLAGGTYWITLENATVNTGDPVYWDENSGPSMASESSVGTIPSEAFTISGPPIVMCPPPSSCGPGCAHDKDGFSIIHNFSPGEDSPDAGLAIDRAANVYGTRPGGNGLGAVYQLALRGANWFYTSLYSFLGDGNGQNPRGEIVGPDSALYGMADGGFQNCGSSGDQYCGVIYKLRPSPMPCLNASCSWTEDVVHQFGGDPDGATPSGNLVFDQAGNLYGSTLTGGTHDAGTIYRLTPSSGGWTETILYNFTGSYGGSSPGLIALGHDGYLYGSSSAGLFRLSRSGANWALKVISGPPPDGCSGFVQDIAGNLYCTAVDRYNDRNLFGEVWELSYGDWRWSLIEDVEHYICTDFNDVCYDVFNSLATNSAGEVYVTEGAQYHRYHPECQDYAFICDGNIHRLVPPGQELIDFNGNVFRDLEIGANGNFYGTTGACGSSRGTVWQLTPP